MVVWLIQVRVGSLGHAFGSSGSFAFAFFHSGGPRCVLVFSVSRVVTRERGNRVHWG